jgi:hypothetical protein
MLAVAVRALAQAGAGAGDSHVIFADANGHDANPGSAAAPVASLDRALALAHALAPSEAMPVLIRLGQGAFPAPTIKSLAASDFSPGHWWLTHQHIYFAGNGPDNTRILAARIIIDPAAITGFKDLMLDATVELGDSFLPVNNVQVREHEATGGQLDGLWRDAAGAVHVSRFSAEKVATALPSLAAHGSAVAQLISNIFLITNRLVHPATPPLTYSTTCSSRPRRHQHLRPQSRRHHDGAALPF